MVCGHPCFPPDSMFSLEGWPWSGGGCISLGSAVEADGVFEEILNEEKPLGDK